MNAALRRVGGYALATVLMLVAWQLAAWLLASPALPGPAAAFGAFAADIGGILPHLGISTFRVVASTLLGLAVGAPLGLLLGRSPAADTVFAPIVFLNYPIPKAVFLPVLLVLLGIGNLSIIVLITLIVVFQILVTARDAARQIPEASVLSVRSLGASERQVFRHVVIPAAMPEIFTALRIGAGTAVAVLFFSETFAGSTGLGYYVVDAWGAVQYARMFAGILAMALLGVGMYELIELVEARVCRWERAGRRA